MSRRHARARAVVAAIAACALLGMAASCSVPPYPGTPAAPPHVTASTPRPAPPVPKMGRPAPVPTVVDSGPSREALEVLDTIPEPVGVGEERDSTAGAGARGEGSSDEDAGVPVPSPTQPLGDRPGPNVAPDSSAAPPDSGSARPSQPPPEGPPQSQPQGPPPESPPSTSTAPTQACWRVQLAAPENSEEAEQVRSAAASQLVIAVVVESDGRFYKVRSEKCFDREGAVQLRDRAVASGFEGAFLIRGPAR